MIYINCKRRGEGARVSVAVCEKSCRGACPDYEYFIERRDWYIQTFFCEEACPFCGGTGITESSYRCDQCGAHSPWRFL